MAKLYCPQHGNYDAAYGSCPVCRRSGVGRPVQPSPLGQDNIDTNFGDGTGETGGFRGGWGGGSANLDDAPTEIPGGRKAGGFPGDEEETFVKSRREYRDDTEIDSARVEATPHAILWEKSGPHEGRIIKLAEKAMTIGRDIGEIIVDDPKVSNMHARLARINDEYIIVDCLSKNGTYINGVQIHAETVLKENDVIRVGGTTFELKMLGGKKKPADADGE